MDARTFSLVECATVVTANLVCIGSFLFIRRRLFDGTAAAMVRRTLARTMFASDWLPSDAEVYDTGLGSYVIKSACLPRGPWMYFRKWKTVYGEVRHLCVTTPNSDGYLWGMDFDPVAWPAGRRAERMGTIRVFFRKIAAATYTPSAAAGKQPGDDRPAGDAAQQLAGDAGVRLGESSSDRPS